MSSLLLMLLLLLLLLFYFLDAALDGNVGTAFRLSIRLVMCFHLLYYHLDNNQYYQKKNTIANSPITASPQHQIGLTREFSSTFKPTFYRAQFFTSHAHSQRVQSAVAGQLTTALFTSELEG